MKLLTREELDAIRAEHERLGDEAAQGTGYLAVLLGHIDALEAALRLIDVDALVHLGHISDQDAVDLRAAIGSVGGGK